MKTHARKLNKSINREPCIYSSLQHYTSGCEALFNQDQAEAWHVSCGATTHATTLSSRSLGSLNQVGSEEPLMIPPRIKRPLTADLIGRALPKTAISAIPIVRLRELFNNPTNHGIIALSSYPPSSGVAAYTSYIERTE